MTPGEKIEAALRSLSDAHSMARRLQNAGVSDELICRYLHTEAESVSTLLDVARRKVGQRYPQPPRAIALQPLYAPVTSLNSCTSAVSAEREKSPALLMAR